MEADDTELIAVDCPEWGGVVYLGTPSGQDRDRIDAYYQDLPEDGPNRLDNVRAHIVATCWRTEDGEPVTISPEQVKMLGKKSGKVIDRLFAECQRLAGMTKDDVEALTKNSNGRSDDSGSDSA